MKRYMRKINLYNATVITKPVFTEMTKDYRKSHPVWHCDKCNAPVVFVESKSTGKKYLSGIKKYRRHGNRYADWKLWVNYYPSFEPHSKSCKGEAMNMPQTETTQEVIQPREEIIMKNENKTGKVYAGSGSRSLKQDPQMFDKVVMRLIEMIETTKPAMLITGMAEGFDEALAIAAMATSTPLKAMIPFKGYCNHYWGLKSVTGRNRLDECKEIIAYAQSTGGVEYICSDWNGPDGRSAMIHRNEAMANACDKAWIYNPVTPGTKRFKEYCDANKVRYYVIKIDEEGPGDTPQTPTPTSPKEDNMKKYLIKYADNTEEIIVTDKSASELGLEFYRAGKGISIKPYKEEDANMHQITNTQEQKTVKKAAPQEALIKRELLAPETQEWILSILENQIAPVLVKDVSSYAPGRMRTWMPYEAPLDTAASKDKPFVPGVLHDELWQWIVDLCHKHGMKAQTCLISKGGNIKPHRDTTYADAWAMGINLGVCNWHIASDRDSAKTDYSMALKGGEVFSFNSKHVHAVTDAAPDRWAINVWAIADTKAAQTAQIHQRIESMLNSNEHVRKFIDLHQPGAGKTEREEVMQAPQISHWDSPDDQYYWDSLSEAAQECLSLYQKMDPEFHNDDPYDFINPDEVARHVHNVMTLGWGDFRHLMNQAEVQQYNLLYPNKEEEVVKTPQITNIQASIQEAIEPRKEKEMKAPNIFHWLEESDVTNAAGNLVENYYAKDSEMVMVITNNPNPSRRQAYQDALMGGGSVKYNEKLGLWLMPVRTGTWGFHYLERLNDKGIKFTVTIRRLDLMVERYDERDDTDDRSVGEVMVEQANLAWVDNKNLYLVDIDGVPAGGEFDWSLIGITANDAKKLTKRMAEIVRLAKSGSPDELRVMVLNPEMKTKNPDFWVKVFDGKNAIRFSALPEDMRKSLKKSGHLHIMGRGFTHVDGKKFLVKGDFVVVPDYMWTWENVDVVAHGENLKTEVTTDEDLWTFWEHAPLHATTWDQQTMLNYPRILTVKSMRDDYLAEMNGIDAQLEKGLLPGQVESDLQIQAEEEIHDEFKKLVPKAEEIRKNRDLATKIKEAGFDVRMFQNLVYMSLNGFANSKAKFMHIPEFDKEGNPNYLNGKHDKHVVTMRNSFRATCVTDTFLKHFVGIPYSTERIAFFDKNVGMVWNGEHFARTFELHGTHDNDDTHFFVPVKLWSDDPKTVAKLKKSGVMLDNLAIPDKAENAKMVLLVLRLPNGAGEYSIMEFDFNTWPKEIPFDESLVKTHNLSFGAGWVKPQPMCIPNNMPGLPTSRVYSKVSYTRADLLTDLKAQYVNPGFGAMCNALVSYSSITHGGIPSCMTDSLGNIVDATQQGADIKSFEAIHNLMDDIKTELAQIGGTIDTYFYYRRGAVAKTGVKAGTVYVRDGEIEEFDSEYKSIYTKLKYDIKKKYSFKMRQSVRINQEITRMTFNAELIAWCKKFILNMEENLSANDKMDTGMVPSKFTKPVHQAILRERRHSVVDAAIAQLEALPNTDEVMLCMWYTILTPKLMGPHATHGSSDRAICQMGSERALAHLLIDAIVNMQEKRKANVGANKVVFTSNKLVDGAFVNHVVKPLQADRATQMPIDIISDIIGKIPQNFKFVWIMADNKPLAVFRRQNSTFVEAHADLPETINL